eukprot:TRINITY_DN66525_c0_g2_i1.p1 TRINITY_DN66525_c0_g2~~TRINITY_DN66525_c0_g2_i1.p1  ORF type:complete len:557 (-),score=57.15 TRINITY_DN66525_c0_g2_i1:127-1632(-)
MMVDWVKDTDFLERLVTLVDDWVIRKFDKGMFMDSDEFLKFMGDAKLDQHLKGTSLSTIETLCRSVYRWSGDRVLLNTFEAVGSTIINSHEYNAFLAVFEIAENRENFIKAMENIVHLVPQQVNNMPTADLLQLLGNTPQVLKMGQIVGSYNMSNEHPNLLSNFTARILSELQTSLPYRMFVSTAGHVKSADVRNIISDSNDRYTLPTLVVETIADGGVQFAPWTPRKTQPREATPPHKRAPITTHDTSLKLTSKRRDILKALQEKGASYELVTELRILTEAQLKQLAEVLFTIAEGTTAGQFFSKYQQFLRENTTPEEAKRRRLSEHAMWTLKAHMKLKATDLLQSFGDAESFANRVPADKKKILMSWVDNEDAIGAIVAMDKEQLQRYFTHLFAPPAGTNSLSSQKMLELQRRRRDLAWVEVNGIVKHNLGVVSTTPISMPDITPTPLPNFELDGGMLDRPPSFSSGDGSDTSLDFDDDRTGSFSSDGSEGPPPVHTTT